MSELETVVQGLSAELAARKKKRWIRALSTLAGLAVLIGAWVLYSRKTAPEPEPRFSTAKVEKRDVIEEVQSTGVVEPVTQVDVGAQVSGRVVSVQVDFNDQVKKGQLLAEIDPQLFSADVNQQGAQLQAAQAAIKSAEARRDAVQVRVDRLKPLVAENIASLAELENAEGELQVAEAELNSAKAQIAQIQARLSSARTTLDYTKIHSPIDGVVINRQIEPGQTVASSFNTPVLFVIAQDLTKMRVLSEIDEADVGKVQEGMKAEITVDAFVEEKFEGELTQIRLAPNNVEGVVTYSAVILVENRDGMLRPGMTATATVVTSRADQSLAIRNSALRFEPLEDEGKEGEASKKSPPEPLARPGPGQARVYLEGEGPPQDPGAQPLLIDVGITDGVWTVVKDGLEAGQEVIVDETPREKKGGFRLF